MFFSFSSLLSVVFLCSLLIMFICFYLRDVDRIIQLGIKNIFIFIGIIAIRLIFPFEFVFSNSLASRYMMPKILSVLHTTVISAFGRNFTIIHILFFVWVIGIIISTITTIKTHIFFGQVIKQLPILCDSKIDEIVHTITQDYKKPMSFQIVHSNLISTPVLYGFHNPKIIVPEMDLTYEEWHFILKHEIIHFYNRDLQIKMFVQLLRIIYWWNPLVYLLNHQIDKMLEFRTDLEVTKNLNEYEKTQYLDCLLTVAKNLSCKKDDYYCVAFDNGKASVLSQRFHLILGHHNHPGNRPFKTIFMTVPLIILLFFSFSTVFESYSISPEDESYTVELTTKNSCLVKNRDGGYDVYFNGVYFSTVTSIKDSYSDLPVYKDLEDAPQK